MLSRYGYVSVNKSEFLNKDTTLVYFDKKNKITGRINVKIIELI